MQVLIHIRRCGIGRRRVKGEREGKLGRRAEKRETDVSDKKFPPLLSTDHSGFYMGSTTLSIYFFTAHCSSCSPFGFISGLLSIAPLIKLQDITTQWHWADYSVASQSFATFNHLMSFSRAIARSFRAGKEWHVPSRSNPSQKGWFSQSRTAGASITSEEVQGAHRYCVSLLS